MVDILPFFLAGMIVLSSARGAPSPNVREVQETEIKSDYPSIVPPLWPDNTSPPSPELLHDDAFPGDDVFDYASETTVSHVPSMIPSEIPSTVSSDMPSTVPSDMPSMVPSDMPSMVPSDVPSMVPSDMPSMVPSDMPSMVPSDVPSIVPTSTPSLVPSTEPSFLPSSMLSSTPSKEPSELRSGFPSTILEAFGGSVVDDGSENPFFVEQQNHLPSTAPPTAITPGKGHTSKSKKKRRAHAVEKRGRFSNVNRFPRQLLRQNRIEQP